MTVSDATEVEPRSYGCSLACGNPYDFIVVLVEDSSTQMLCTPCFVRTAADMLEAMLNPDDPEVQQRIASAGDIDTVPMKGRQVAKRGHEAPADSLDPDAIEVFESYVLDDEIDAVLG
jgi:hypothetical protein